MTENPSRTSPILGIRALFWILYSLTCIAIKESESLYFPKNEYMVRISESTSRGKIISQIRAFDSFNISCESSLVLYSLKAMNDVHSGLVGINETSGEVKLLLNERAGQIKGIVPFQLEAYCQNGSLMTEPALAILKLFQDDVEEDNGRACWADSDYVFKIQENSKEFLLYTFPQNERAEYQISRVYDEDDEKHNYIKQHFRIHNENQQLLLRQALDREEEDHLILNISCRIKSEDADHATSSQLFTVYVEDVDDNPPVFYKTETQFMELNVTNGDLPMKLPLITDRDQNLTDLNTYKITITKGVTIVQVKEFNPMLRHPLGPEGQQKDRPKLTTIILKLSQSAKLSSLPFSTFDVNLTDTKYRSDDNLYTPTATLRFRVGTAAVVTTDAPKPKALVAHVYRNASKYTKILTLSDNKSIRHGEYRMIGKSDIMAVTSKTGIVFVNSPSKLSINKSEIHLIVKTPQRVNQLVTIKLRGSVNTEKKNCDYGCAELHKEECESGCGYGAPMAACNWRKGSLGLTAAYATCRPDAHTCPDGFCDELEEQNQHICPQDCVRATIIGEGFINTIKGGIKEAKSPCWCKGDFNVVCNCGLEIPLPTTTSNSSYTLSTEKQRVIMKTSPFKEDSEEKGCDESCRTSVAATVSCALALLLLVLIATFFWKRYKKQSRTLKHVGSILSMTAMPSDYIDDIERRVSHSSPQWPPSPKSRDEEVDANWEFPRANLILEDTLGEGEFGQVVRGQAYGLNGDDCYTTVAVKMLKPDASGTEYQDLISELNLLKEVKHPNVIRLLGACTQKGPHYVIVEFCEFGSLKNYLRKCKYRGRRSWEDKQNQHDGSYQNETDEILTTRDLMSFAWQTTRGMEYLSRMKLVHRDLAARNVLVATGKQLKISDFGLSRDVYEADTYLKMSKGRIPVKWMAPESLYAQIYTTKSDIWSFGVVLWEIVTLGANPYPGIPPERLFNLLKTGYRMDRPDDCPDELYAIMQKCWKSEPEERPTFTALTYIIDRMLQDRVGYLELQGDSDYLEDKTSVSGSVEKKILWQDSGDGYGNITVVKPDDSFYPPSDDEISDNNMAKFGRDEENESRKLLLRTNHGVQKDLSALNSSVSNIYSV